MKINYLLVSRLTTNLTLLIFMLFAAGFILWTSDEFLNWDILPDWIDNYAQLIIVIFGFFAFLLGLSSLLSSSKNGHISTAIAIIFTQKNVDFAEYHCDGVSEFSDISSNRSVS